MSTPGGRDQVPENLTPEGRAIVQRLDAVIAVLNAFSENQDEVNEAVSARLQQGEKRLSNHDELIADSRARLQEGAKRLANQEGMIAELKELNAAAQARLQQGEERLANQEVMLAELKELNAEARSRLQHGEEHIAGHDALIAESRAQLQQGAERLANQEVMLAELKELNAEARVRLQHGEEHIANHDALIAEARVRLQHGEEHIANHDALIAEARAQLQQGAERLAGHDALIAESRAQLQQGAERLARSELHLGYLRGAHAVTAARREADLIAEDIGYQLVNLLPKEMLISFANMARASGKHENNVRSFREADLIMLVRDAVGQPAYVTVEASFTVAARDIARAKRNAEYLHEFTGLPATGAVAGVEITSGQRRNAIAAGVHCYTIPVRDLEAD